MAEEANGFLGRWARRKTDVLQGRPLQEPELATKPATAAAAAASVPSADMAAPAALDANTAAEAAPAAPVLSLDDAKLLTKDSDFTPFMARGVGAEVRNAAMKKLFADPHFNIMDGLDIYIDDYSKSDPIPESMLRQMTGAKFLNLFPEDQDSADQNAAVSPAWENADNSSDQTVAQSPANANLVPSGQVTPEISSQAQPSPEATDLMASLKDHADTDLRLQPDHAAPASDAGRGPQ